jgi:hypothetical protein
MWQSTPKSRLLFGRWHRALMILMAVFVVTTLSVPQKDNARAVSTRVVPTTTRLIADPPVSKTEWIGVPKTSTTDSTVAGLLDTSTTSLAMPVLRALVETTVAVPSGTMPAQTDKTVPQATTVDSTETVVEQTVPDVPNVASTSTSVVAPRSPAATTTTTAAQPIAPIVDPVVVPPPVADAASPNPVTDRQRLLDGLIAQNSTEANKQIGKLLAAERGWTGQQWLDLDQMWFLESAWHTQANNGQGCNGIPQSCPASKMSAAGADWATNPVTQITWGLDYIASIYGDPSTAFYKRQSRCGGQYGCWY